jgi:hypothetical protein
MHEVRCGGWFRCDAALAVALALFLTAALAPPSQAVMKYGPLQISGNVDSYNLVRTPDIGWNPTQGWNKVQYVMNRNALRVRIDWDWLQNGRLIDRFDLPFIERSKLYLLYRGVYDGFYDIASTDPQVGQTRYDDLVGGPIAGNAPGQCVGGACGDPSKGNVSYDASGNLLPPQRALLPGTYSRFNGQDRTNNKFENRLREAYVDFKIKNAPLSFRIGRQQIIWGESDQFRVMDCWNPLDIGWHFQIDSWDEIRVPEWLGKGLWEIGEVGPLSNSFLEVVYNPFDYHNGTKNSFLPKPWAVPFADPVRGGQVQTSSSLGYLSPVFDLEGTSFDRGDFQKNPQDASEVGTRFHAVTPQGVEFTLNYLYGRGRGLGGANSLAPKIDSVDIPYLAPNGPLWMPGTPAHKPAVGQYQADINNPNSIQYVMPVNVKMRLMQPYQHIFGTTANYFEGDFTQAVWRLETAYVMNSPFATTDPNTLVPITIGGKLQPALTQGATAPFGYTKRDIWTGMFGFDRPTWIRILNPRATWFLTAQFFWTYVTGGHVDQLIGNTNAGDAPYYGPVGRWVTGPYAGLVERAQYGDCTKGVGPGCGNGDNWHRWEHLITFAGTSFYRSGTLVPFYAFAWDPVNDSSQVWMNLAYYYSNNFIITLYENLWWTYGSNKPSNDNEYTGGRMDRRDESGIKLTFQF